MRTPPGAHLNPAVTCALVACDKAPAEEAPFYIGAQLAGATVAAAVNYLIFSAGIKALEAAQQVDRAPARGGSLPSARCFPSGAPPLR